MRCLYNVHNYYTLYLCSCLGKKISAVLDEDFFTIVSQNQESASLKSQSEEKDCPDNLPPAEPKDTCGASQQEINMSDNQPQHADNDGE